MAVAVEEGMVEVGSAVFTPVGLISLPMVDDVGKPDDDDEEDDDEEVEEEGSIFISVPSVPPSEITIPTLVAVVATDDGSVTKARS